MNGAPAPAGQAPRYAVPLIFAALVLALQLLISLKGGYGYFRDEFYYLACSEFPDLGYVDQPPLSIYLLGLSRALLGDSLVAVRLLPALAGAATVFLIGLLAGELGGGKFAQATASLAAAVSPVAAAFAGYFSMNAFDVLCWALAAFAVARLVTSGDSRTWLLIGLIVGLGTLNKLSALWLGAAIAAGVLLTGERRWLRTVYPWAAAGIALLALLPYVYWNVTHDFAHLEFIRNASREKYATQSVATFLAGQLTMNSPSGIPVWGAGLFWFFSPAGRRYRIIGFLYCIPLLILLVNIHSKPEYLAPAYAVLFAGGGVMLEQWLTGRVWLKAVLLAVTALGAFLLPLAVPILPVESTIRYAKVLGVAPSTAEGLQLAQLPQHFADCFGWEEMTRTVAGVHAALPDSERAGCVIYCQNYGEAGALRFLGRAYGLPPAISGHNNFWLWGPGEARPTAAIVLGGRAEDHLRVFERVDLAARVRSTYAIPYENNLPVYVCRGLKAPLSSVWPGTRHYE